MCAVLFPVGRGLNKLGQRLLRRFDIELIPDERAALYPGRWKRER